MKYVPLPSSFGEPPEALKNVRLDNIALVPASLLPFKETYQPIANTLPKGSILLVQTQSPRQRNILTKVAAFLRTQSRQVITLPIERIKKTQLSQKLPTAQNLPLAL